jgi:hypothetical protein
MYRPFTCDEAVMEVVSYEVELTSKMQAFRRNMFSWVSLFLEWNWHIGKYLSECIMTLLVATVQ